MITKSAQNSELNLEYASSTQLARLMIASGQQLLAILQHQGNPMALELAVILKQLQAIEQTIEAENTVAFDWSQLDQLAA